MFDFCYLPCRCGYNPYAFIAHTVQQRVKLPPPGGNGSGHGALAGVLNALNADVLICGGIGGGAQTALAAAGIKLFGGVSGDADEAVEAFINETLEYNPDVKCSHHEHNNGEGHTCGEHGCGSHSCH